MILPAAISILSALLGFHLTHRFLKDRTIATRLIFLVAFTVMSVPAVLFAVYYLHVIPETAWFYVLRSWTGSEALAIFVGAAGGALATFLPRWLLILPLLGAFGTAAVPYLKTFVRPLDQTILKDQWKDDAALQSTASTCGPASTASILRYLGHAASEREIAIASYTSATGTEAWYLARYLRSRGLETRFRFHEGLQSSESLPAVVGVRVSGYGHFIAVLAIKNDKVTFVDPLSGKQILTLNKFKQRYNLTGFRMSVR